jgi:hypothetical protein
MFTAWAGAGKKSAAASSAAVSFAVAGDRASDDGAGRERWPRITVRASYSMTAAVYAASLMVRLREMVE